MGRRRLKIVASPKQYPTPDVPFDAFHGYWKDDLRKIAHSHSWRLRKSSYGDDIIKEAEAEVYFAFWTAYLHWRPDLGEFGKLFWTIWLNRLHTVARSTTAAKRTGELISYSTSAEWAETLAVAEEVPDLPIYGIHQYEELVIKMLAEGYRPSDVREVVGRKAYNEVVTLWRGAYLREHH